MNRRIISQAVIYAADAPEEKFSCTLPRQVHEVLIANNKMENPVITHDGTESIEFSKKDWIYQCDFQKEEEQDKTILLCKGLDTVVDIWLNGEKIGEHKDMYYPFRCDITDRIKENNCLLFYFKSPVTYLENYEEPKEWKGVIPKSHYIRKATHDYADFLGIKPYFCPVGVFDSVELLEYSTGCLQQFRIENDVNWKNRTADIKIHTEGEWFADKCGQICASLLTPDGTMIRQEKKELSASGKFAGEFNWMVEDIELWWPVGYGGQPLYTVIVSLETEGICLESQIKKVGFRKIQYGDNFRFWINGEKIRLWGANLVPVDGITHCFNQERTEKLLRLAVEANMNCLRLWGGGEPFPEDVYDMADRMGILIWTEFFHNYGMFPDSQEFMILYEKEARYLVEKFSHHAAVFLWCGGNECQMTAELLQSGKRYIGEKIFHMYSDVLKELAPDLLYYENSPSGGEFYNDPRKGDMHGWNNIWYVPYEKYPVFFSENSRVSPPVYRSLKKYIPDSNEFWPEGFLSRRTRFSDELFPPAWMKLTGGPESYRCSPVEEFYDADTPEKLIYVCQAAHALSMKRYGERIKRGKGKEEKIKCQGELIWKLNDTWPQIYCGLLDYDLEPGQTYFAVKRVFEKVQISFNMEEHIEIWGVNDLREAQSGVLTVCVFNMEENRILYQKEMEVELPGKDSRFLTDLDEYPMFLRTCVLYACLKDRNGIILCRNYDFVEIERNLPYPDAVICLEQEGDEIIIKTDKFAHNIELSGLDDGNEMGFVFEDNYFNLMPFETRKIKVRYEKKEFDIMARSAYSAQETKLHYKRRK